MPCLVLSCRVLSCRVLSCLVVSCLLLFRRVLSCRVLSCLVLSCLVVSCLVVSCLVLSCLILSCLVSCLVLSCLLLLLLLSVIVIHSEYTHTPPLGLITGITRLCLCIHTHTGHDWCIMRACLSHWCSLFYASGLFPNPPPPLSFKPEIPVVYSAYEYIVWKRRLEGRKETTQAISHAQKTR